MSVSYEEEPGGVIELKECLGLDCLNVPTLISGPGLLCAKCSTDFARLVPSIPKKDYGSEVYAIPLYGTGGLR